MSALYLSLSFDDRDFELNELKAQSQEKDTVIRKLQERIISLSGNVNEDKVKKDIDEIETINIELDHKVLKLIAENKHLKQNNKQLYDSIKPIRLIIAALRDKLRKLKGKDLVDDVVTTHTIASEMLQVDMEPLATRLLNNRTAHSDYLRLTQEQAVILKVVVKQGKSQNPLNNSLDSASRHDLARGLPKLKFKKDHMCSTCAIRKSKKKLHKPKSKDTNQEKLYLLHMDLCGPIRVASVNGKKFILVIVDDYSRSTWVGISHETSVACSPQANGVVERRNRTLIKSAYTMLIYVKAPLFLWEEAVATACYTQNRYIIRLRHDKTPY
nr:hypothetical protein [Tanacetum cinerariifolium]